MARGDQLIRQWRLLHILGVRGGRTADDLMQEMKCSRRTVWRDLAVLQKAGFPITTEQDGRERRYRLIEAPRGAPPVPFTLTELMSLHLGRHLLVPLRGTPAGEGIHTALEKVSATLGPAAKNFDLAPGNWSSGKGILSENPFRGGSSSLCGSSRRELALDHPRSASDASLTRLFLPHFIPSPGLDPHSPPSTAARAARSSA